MLYLAEVQRKTGFIGSGKAEFSLLACQRGEQDWSSIPGDEVIPAPDDASYNAGALVMVELSSNRQVQRHYEAGRTLVSILQGFSNLSKKFKTQEEEIEQWKQSLTFQSQELNRREMEIESRQEQLEQAEADLEQLENQHQELLEARQTLEQAQADLDRKNQELEGAWAHLNGESRRLEEQQEALASTASLDEQKVSELQEALNQLTGAIIPTENLREHIQLAESAINQQQGFVDEQRQKLEQQRAEVAQKQQTLDARAAELKERWVKWHQAEEILIHKQAELKLQQQVISTKQEHIQNLNEELRRQGSLHQQVYELLNSSDKVRLSKKVDVAALDDMPIEDLQQLVKDLEQDLEKVSNFVSDQEEELRLQQQSIDQLKDNINQASEFDRLQIEAELVDEQDRYRMLNETLVGQRRNLVEREEVLSQHQAILLRRQGLAKDDAPIDGVDLEPLLDTIDSQRQITNEIIQKLETEVRDIQTALQAAKEEIDHNSHLQSQEKEQMLQIEAELDQERNYIGQLLGHIRFHEEILPILENQLQQYQERTQTLANSIAQFQEASDYQLQAISEMRQTVMNLANSSIPEATASS